MTPPAMSPARFRAALKALGWSQRYLASPEQLGCDTHLPARWASGKAAIPVVIAEWLDALVAFHEAHPAPDTWRQRDGEWQGLDRGRKRVRREVVKATPPTATRRPIRSLAWLSEEETRERLAEIESERRPMGIFNSNGDGDF